LSELPQDRSAPPQWEGGDTEAQNALFACLYDELRHVAQRELRRGAGLTLSATTLLHETYFKVRQRSGINFPEHSRFLAYAARAMRSLVIDHARNRQAQKRGGGYETAGQSRSGNSGKRESRFWRAATAMTRASSSACWSTSRVAT
jgi:RNA polymerase sigma factor (TIGR02999 family)